jgi:DNA-binding MarR family transcriptional regulator
MSAEPLDPVIHQSVRLRVMALLSRNRAASFVWVRDTLGLTDGNLGSHTARLVAFNYAESTRMLTRSGFQVWLRITPKGDEAYRAYLAALRSYLGPADAIHTDSPAEATLPNEQSEK